MKLYWSKHFEALIPLPLDCWGISILFVAWPNSSSWAFEFTRLLKTLLRSSCFERTLSCWPLKRVWLNLLSGNMSHASLDAWFLWGLTFTFFWLHTYWFFFIDYKYIKTTTKALHKNSKTSSSFTIFLLRSVYKISLAYEAEVWGLWLLVALTKQNSSSVSIKLDLWEL